MFCSRRCSSGEIAWVADVAADAGAFAGALADCENEKTELKTSAAETSSDFETTENLNIYAGLLLVDYLTREGVDAGYFRRKSVTGSSAFMDPERKPSRSKVTNLKPRALKIRVNSAAMLGSSARGSSGRSISMRTISP